MQKLQRTGHIGTSVPDAKAIGSSGDKSPIISFLLFAVCAVCASGTFVSAEEVAPVPTDSPNFRQSIALGHSVGTPSAITLTTQEGGLQQIRILFVLDGRLLTVPMQKRDGNRAFFAIFPTPSASLTYQIQFIRSDGTALLSEHFTADPHCTQQRLERALATATNFPAQAPTLRKATELQQQILLLEYLAKVTEQLGR